MEDALTRRAIQEIISEIYEQNTQTVTTQTVTARKPPVKPNKEFLGRTITSIVSHNKRESDMQQKRCRDKLRELDRKSYSFESKRNEHRRNHYRAKHGHDSSGSSENEYEYHKRKKKKKKTKRKKSKERRHKSKSKSVNKVNTKEDVLAEKNHQDAFDSQVYNNSDENFTLTTFALNHMSQNYLYQQILLGNENTKDVQSSGAKDADFVSVAITSSSSPVLTVSSFNSETNIKQRVPTINLLTDNESEEDGSNESNSNFVNEDTNSAINLSSDEFDLNDSTTLSISSEHTLPNIISLDTDSNSNCHSLK